MKKIHIIYFFGLFLSIAASSLTFAESAAEVGPRILYEEIEHYELIENVYHNIISNYQGADQTLDSLLKTATDAEKQQEYEWAKNAYQKIIQKYPHAPLVKRGQLDLARMDVLSSLKSGDDTAADAAIDKLLTDFSDNEHVAEAIHHTAYRCRLSGKHKKADRLDGCVTKSWPQSDYALWAQMDRAEFNIDLGNKATAQAEINKLITDFASHPRIAEALHHVAFHYQQLKKYDEAQQLDEYVISHWPTSDFALWAQMDIAEFNTERGDEVAADAAVAKLLTNFSKHPRIAEAVHHAAFHYQQLEKYDKAVQLYQRNVKYFSKDDKYTMWSQVEIIKSLIRDGNEAAADIAVAKLLTNFSKHPRIAEAVYQVAKMFDQAGDHHKALKLNQYLIDTWSDNGDPNSCPYIAMAQIALGNEDTATKIIDNLFSNYKDRDLSEVIFTIGEQHWDRAMSNRQKGLKDKAKEDFAKALVVWERIVEELPNHSSASSNACYFSAECYYHMGQYEKAIKHFQKVLIDWPGYEYGWSVYGFLGACYEKLKKSGRITESQADPLIEQAYKTVIDKYPDCRMVGHACLKLAKLTSRKKRWGEAAGYYGAFLNNYPEDKRCKSVLYDLGYTYEQMGKLENAAQVYQLIVQQGNPKDKLVKNSMKRLTRITKGAGK